MGERMSIEIRFVDEYPEDVFDDLVERNLHTMGTFIPCWEHYFEGDPSFELKGKRLKVAAFDGDKMIGLSWGKAEGKNRFMMYMSLVEREYRERGIYKKMLNLILENTKEFDEVDSTHHMMNNNIIALKLKCGFHIVGMDQSTLIGPRIRLRYYHNQDLLEIMKFRMGMRDNPANEC